MRRITLTVTLVLLAVVALSIDHPPSTSADANDQVVETASPIYDASPFATIGSLPAPTTTTTTTTAPRPTTTTTAPQVVPQAASAPVVASSGNEQIIADVFGSEASTALRVARCESNMNPNAVGHNTNGTSDHGLFQINSHWNQPSHSDPVAQWIGARWASRYDPHTNTLMAKKIRDKYGWSQWYCY